MMTSSGPPPLDGDTNLGPGNVETIIVLLAVSIILVVLRFATKIWIVRNVWWDDWTILLALLGTLIGSILDFVEVHYGFGRHQYYLSDYQKYKFLRYTWGEWIQTFATLMWTKVSICLFLLRIPASKALIRPLQAAVAFLILSNLIITLLWILQCRPVNAAWNKSIQGKCLSKSQLKQIIFIQAIISVVSDFTLSSYPILILWRVQLKLKTKIGLCILMGLGFITGACCIVRTVLNGQSLPEDITFGGVTNWYWRSFEVTIGFVAACIPTIRPGYKWFRHRLTTKEYLSENHLPLNDKPKFYAPHEIKVARPASVYSAFAGVEVPVDLRSTHRLPLDSQILKTTRVDVKKELVGRVSSSSHYGGRPSIDISFGPSFKIERGSWIIDISNERRNFEDVV